MLAALLMLAAGTSQAGRGDWRGGGSHGRGSVRGNSDHGQRRSGGGSWRGDGHASGGGGEVRYKDGGGARGGGGHSGGGSGEVRYKGDGGTWGGGGRTYGGADRGYRAGHGRSYSWRGPVAWGGGARGYGGAPYWTPRHYGPIGYRYARPRAYLSYGIQLGLPYYCPPAYRYHVHRVPVVVESEPQIDVGNEPPAGCYYFDPFCEREFTNLDEYTDHIDREDHPKTIQVIERESGERVRTLEFVGGFWEVQR